MKKTKEQRMKGNICKDRFKGYVALVAGAGSGIGQACAVRFAKEGAVVLACDINEHGLKETENVIKSLGGYSESYKLDVTDVGQVRSVVGDARGNHGKIDVLVYSAGCVKENELVDVTNEEWLWQINVNLNGAFYLTKPVLRSMREKRFGKIIYISSKSGILGRPARSAYSASKFGLNGLTQALALEVAKEGINVNSVCPSRVMTSMIKQVLMDRAEKYGIPYEKLREEHDQSVPIGRMGTPEEIAGVVAFLASEDATYITGQFISVSGGR